MVRFKGHRRSSRKGKKDAICEIRVGPGVRTTIIPIMLIVIIFSGTASIQQQQAHAAVSPSSTTSSSESSLSSSLSQRSPKSSPCNCVVFRLDDIQNFWLHDVQLAALGTFSESNTKVTPGLIMNYYGADAPLMEKIQQGKEEGTYELALHGWNHVDYAKLSLAEQERTLSDANTKLETLHRVKSNIFITPYNSLNENTLIAMKDNGLEIISADADPDDGFLAPTYPGSLLYSTSSSLSSSLSSSSNSTHEIKSIPMTVNFTDRHKPAGSNGKTLVQLKSEIDASIAGHGWAVIMLHPQDFAVYKDNDASDGSGNRIAEDTVNSTQIAVLKRLIGQLATDGRTVTSFNGLVQAFGDNNTQESEGAAATTTIIATGAATTSPDTSKQANSTSTQSSEHITLSDHIVGTSKQAAVAIAIAPPAANTRVDDSSRFTLAARTTAAADTGDSIVNADQMPIKGEDTNAHAATSNAASPSNRTSLWSIMQSLLSGLANIITHMFGG